MNTINAINEVFENIATNHQIIQGFYTHRIDELDAGKITIDKYPLLYAQCTNATIYESYVEYEYEVIVADYVTEEHEDQLTSVYNDTFLLMQDVIAQFVFSANSTQNTLLTSVDLPITCQPFTARFSNVLTGWSISLDIKTPMPLTLCDVPFA